MKAKLFKRVILYARQEREKHAVLETLQQVATYLGRHHEVFLDPETAQTFDLPVSVLPRVNLDATQDIMLVVGGDGSLLSAAQIAIQYDIAVVGINRGYLGFLTDISPNDFAKHLDQILQGAYLQEARSLLEIRVYAQNKICFAAEALNEVVLSRGNETRLITFDVFIDEQFVSHYRADGLILATPTGSTAYALSAGGPIVHPSLNAMVLVPMFSHSFSARPLVIDDCSEISLHISSENAMPLQLSCDGHLSYAIEPGQDLRIKKSAKKLRLVHPHDHRYYDTLRIKLGWGSEA